MSKLLSISMAVLLFAANTALADWDYGDPFKMHFPQLPDESELGLNVHATWPWNPAAGTSDIGKTLADDFLCIQSGPIDSVHIWGSWLNDLLPRNEQQGVPDANAVSFRLSIHEDIPDPDGPTGLGYSKPGAKLWEQVFDSDAYGGSNKTARLWSSGTPEGFYDPNTDYIIGYDYDIWQYNFYTDPDTAFHQEEGKIYWLGVQAIADSASDSAADSVFGWKSSFLHWNDDAVYGDTISPFGDTLAWNELRYPFSHQLEGHSMDLAFVIVPEPSSVALLTLGAALLAMRRRVTARRHGQLADLDSRA